MSQIVRKLQNGDKAPEVKQARLFKDGNRDIDLDVLIKGANKNIDQYLQSKNWSRKKKQAFMDAYSDIMNSLDSGAIAQRGVDRKYTDTTGKIQNSQGRGFDAYGEAAHFLDTIVDIVPDYQKEKPKEKTKYDANGLINTFKNKFFGGSDPDAIIWQGRDTKDEKTGKYETSQRASAFAQMLDDYAASLADSDYDYEGSAFKDREDLIARLQTASAQLRDGTFDNNDYAALTALGISGKTARTLFSTDALQEAGTEGDKTPDDPELAAAEKGLAQAEKNKERQQKINEWKKLQQQQRASDELTKKWYTPFTSFQRQVIQLPEAVYDKEKYNNALKKTKYDRQGYYESLGRLFTTYDPITHQNGRVKNIYGQSVLYSDHIANDMDFLNSIGGLVDAGGGDYEGFKYFPQSVDEKSGTVLLYNPQTKQLMREAVYRIPTLYQNIINSAIPGNDNPFAMKQGGVLKFQYGGVNLNVAADNYFKTLKQQQKASEDKKVEERAKASGRTKEEIKAGQRELNEASDLSATDWTRLGAAAADVASIAAAFAPGAGTIASAGFGVGSTLANLGADIFDDSVSAGDAALNAVTGLGMDLVGLVPGFGAAGKSAKIAKNIVRLAPKILTLWGTAQAYEPAKEALSKLMNNKDLTVDDWKALAAGLGALAGLSRMGLASMKTRAMKQNFSTGDKTVQSKSGKMMRATPEELEKLKGAKSLEEANKIVQNLKSGDGKGQELAATFRGWYNPTRLWNNNPRTGEHFDFTRPETPRLKGKDVELFQNVVESNLPFPSWHLQIKNPYTKGIPIRTKKKRTGKPLSEFQKNKMRAGRERKSFNRGLQGLSPEQRRQRIDEAWQKRNLDDIRNLYQFRKQGGIIKADGGTKLYNQSRYGEDFLTNWASLVTTPVTAATVDGKKNTYGKVGKAKGYTFNTTSRLNTVLDLLGQGKMTDNDVSMFQRRHAGMYAGYNPSLSPVYNEQVKQYQTDWNSLGLNQSIIAPGYNSNYDIASKKPISGDSGVSNWKSDGRYDQITDDRRILARKEDYYNNGVLDQAKLDADIAAAKAKGYDYYLDPGSNYYMLRKVEPTPQPTAQQTQSKPQQPQQTRNTELRGLQGNEPTKAGTWLSAFIDQAPNFLAAGRLAGNIANNNRVTAEVKKGLKPLIENTYDLYRRVQGDLATRQAYYTKAAELESLAARPMTSDASLQLAGQLEAKSKGNQYRTEGDLADNQAIKESAEKAWQVQADNTARRTAVANANRARILENNAALHNLEAGRMSANWQSIDNFLKQREYDWRTKRNQQRQFDLGVIKDYLSNKYAETPQMEALRKQILAKADKNEDYSDLWDQYSRLKQDQNTQFTNDYNDAYARIYGLRFNRPTPTYRPFLKDGGKIEVARIKAKTEAAKLFQENIKESVRNNIKMIDNLSRVTKELILKSMSL